MYLKLNTAPKDKRKNDVQAFRKKRTVKCKYLFTLSTKDTGGDCAPAFKNLIEAKDG